jgi:dTDP-4-dehydrorhamnose reductase
MSRLAIVGGSGLLGHYLIREAIASNDTVLSTYQTMARGVEGISEVKLDLRDPVTTKELLERFEPDMVLLPAAMTNVDQCERSPTQAWEINAEGPMNVAKVCQTIGAKMLYVSTDYVFNGMKQSKYYEFDTPDPISIYGQTKLEGERCTMDADKHNLVCRVSVLYGWNGSGKKNFVTWILDELENRRPINVFDDQWVSPTYAPHCAKVLLKLIKSEEKGVFHTSGPDCLNRYEMAVMVAKEFGLDLSLVRKVPTKSVDLLARRPERSCLSVDKTESILDMSMLSFEEGIKAMRVSR